MTQRNYAFGFAQPGVQLTVQQAFAPATPQPAFVPTAVQQATISQQQPTFPSPAAPQRFTAFEASGTSAAAFAAFAPQVPNARTLPAVVTVAVTPQYQAVVAKPSYNSFAVNPQTVNTLLNPVATSKPVNQFGRFVSQVATQPIQSSTYSTQQPISRAFQTTTHLRVPQAKISQPQITNAAPKSHSVPSLSSSYDAALISAASSYYQQKTTSHVATQSSKATTSWYKKDAASTPNVQTVKQGITTPTNQTKTWQNRKPLSQHFCDICKVSCLGPLAYKDHQEGMKHQKKLRAQEITTGGLSLNTKTGQNVLKCELCNVTCTGAETYAAHIKGARHTKTAALHTRLGKPIPSSESPREPVLPTTTTPSSDRVTTSSQTISSSKPAGELEEGGVEKNVQPVGEEFIVEELEGSCKGLKCKLCDCKISDRNVVLIHTRGRKHRVNYKKKVDPTLDVDAGRNASRPCFHAKMLRERRSNVALVSHEHTQDPRIPLRYLETADGAVYPREQELKDILAVVSATETALRSIAGKLMADGMIRGEKAEDGVEGGSSIYGIMNEETPNGEEALIKSIVRLGDLSKELLLAGEHSVELAVLCCRKPTHGLLGRVHSMLPKSLAQIEGADYACEAKIDESCIVVHGNTDTKVACTIHLTSPLMRDELTGSASAQSAPSVPSTLAEQGQLGQKKNETDSNFDSTSPLNLQKCLDSLAALRHAKWFQVKITPIPYGCMLLRILKGMRKKEKHFAVLSQWALELLLEHCINTYPGFLQPVDAFRRLYQSLASGVCLPFGPGLSDPCEKEPSNVFEDISLQQCEGLTAYAQDCVRMMAFNQMSKLLGVELKTPTVKYDEQKSSNCGKRALDDNDEGASGVQTGESGVQTGASGVQTGPSGVQTGASGPVYKQRMRR